LSAWRSSVRAMLDQGAGFDEIRGNHPQISEDDLSLFKSKEELNATKALRDWGKRMRAANVDNHNLGSRGYARKEPISKKEDAALRAEGKDSVYDKFGDPLAHRFIRARYRKEKETEALVTTEKVKDLEKHLVRNLPA